VLLPLPIVELLEPLPMLEPLEPVEEPLEPVLGLLVLGLVVLELPPGLLVLEPVWA